MYTSLFVLVLTVQSSTLRAEISWSMDYEQAQKQSVAEKKPMAVIVGSGEKSYGQVVGDGGLSKEAMDLLSKNYICVYVDSASPRGKKLAQAFELTSGKGVILSDRSGVYQAFWHDGTLTNQQLVSRLETYATVRSSSAYRATTDTLTPPPSYIVQPRPSSYCPYCR